MTKRELLLIKERFTAESDIAKAVERLEAHEPLAYILGEWYFYDEVYKVSPDVLIPRPDTEHVVDKLIKLLPDNGVFADLCTGSGCIAISTLAHRKDCTCIAVDISHEALKIAKYNADLNKVRERIEFAEADILNSTPFDKDKTDFFDILVSNPPYIRSEIISKLEPEVSFEPTNALDGGRDGLIFYRKLINDYKKYVKHGGYMIFEIGYDQAESLHSLCECEIFKDYGGNDRVVVIKCSKKQNGLYS